MTWPALFLGCFVVGFALSALSLALSPLRIHAHLHLPFVHHPATSHVHAGPGFAGCIGAFAVFWVMAHVLWSPNENMQSADYRMVGVLGRIGHSIRDGGTGELIYSHGGTRHSCGARSADGFAIPHGAEVVVTAYDHGIAYVRRWDDLAAEAAQGGGV